MASLGESLEKVIIFASKQVGNLEIGVNKVLWGSANTQPIQTVKYNSASGSLSYVSTPTKATPPPKGNNLVNSGLFNALDALNEVDLCNVITYAVDNINIKKKPRPPRNTWNSTQTALYFLQDQAVVVNHAIDKYTAYPNTFIGSYLGVGPNAQTAKEAITGSGLPLGSDTISGTNVQRYNMYNLLLSIKDTFLAGATTSSGSIFTNEEQMLIASVPGLVGNTNIVNDFLKSTSKYTDYRQITNDDLQKLQTKITTLRSVCTVIQTLDFKSGLALAGNFVGTDIRSQIQKLNKFVDPTRIIPTLRGINSAIQSFIKMAQKVQGILSQAQFIIKLALLFIKVFIFIRAFFKALPLPLMFSTSGVQSALDEARQAAKDAQDGLTRLLKEINALLSVVVLFIRYILANTNELLIRLQLLLRNLEACEAMKNSDILDELKQTSEDLIALQEQLATYIIQYDSKTDPSTAMFGKYDIRVVDEEVIERSIVNKRRRGIALDQNGAIVAQSDLTFATDTSIIISEVKLKLMAGGLVQPTFGSFGTGDLTTVSTSLDYLDSNDVMEDDLNLNLQDNTDLPNNEDESKGLGLNAFINKLPGGKSLRKRVRTSLDASNAKLKEQIGTEGAAARQALNTGTSVATSVGGTETEEQKKETAKRKRRR